MRTICRIGYVIVLAAAVAAASPRGSAANQKVDSSGCLPCHELGTFGADDGSIHGSHSNCADCHDGTPGAGNVFSSSCIECHPASGSAKCDLVNFHEDSVSYTPAGASCLDCHSECGSSTTTTTALQPLIKGNRYEVLFIGSFSEGCNATAVEFRSDNVLVMDCMDGFGSYLSIGNIFASVYWSNNYFLGNGMCMVLTGYAIDSYIVGGGLVYTAGRISPVLMSGYVL